MIFTLKIRIINSIN